MSLVRVRAHAVPEEGWFTVEDHRRWLSSVQVIVPEDMVDMALRAARTEAEFDSIYEYSGRPCIREE
jgi:hypothetical protein